jgi:hypothetical protein
VKTLILAVNEHLLNFMELVCAGHDSANNLEKMWGRKKRGFNFCNIILNQLTFPFPPCNTISWDPYKKYSLVQKKIEPNSAMKYCRNIIGH